MSVALAGRGTLLVGDVHGCAAELRALVELASAQRVILLGDLFTKGPDAPGVWSFVEEQGCTAILGNHDDLLLREPKRLFAMGLPQRALDWLAALPLTLTGSRADGGLYRLVHAGLNPVEGLAGSSRDQLLLLRRWPDDRDPANPFWWESWRGEDLIVYGHDAARGLVDRRPWTLGLDSGCVYGGRLSGYLVEEDRIVSVPAARAYRRPG